MTPEANPVRARIAQGGVALGLIVRIVRSAEIVTVAKASGHDFLFLDTQHAAFDRETVAALVLAARMAGIAALVRLRSPADADAALYLDAGAAGVIVPDVNTADEARDIVRRCRFAPRGARSLPGPLVQDGYRPSAPAEAMRRADAETLIVAMIENAEGVANAGSIAAVDGIDVLHVGCVDLLLSLGRPGEMGCPEMSAAIDAIAAAAQAHGRILGIGGDRDPVRRAGYIRQGARFMTTDLDVTVLLETMTARVAALRAMETP